MKKALPVMLAVAALAVAAPALPVFAQAAPAGGAQASDPEAAAANALYQTWKAETDPAKKLEIGKQIVTQHAADTVEVSCDDPAILADIDTPEDYERALRLWEQSL